MYICNSTFRYKLKNIFYVFFSKQCIGLFSGSSSAKAKNKQPSHAFTLEWIGTLRCTHTADLVDSLC